MSLRIGIDVGGTNTDCVLLNPFLKNDNSRGIIACTKTLTTPDITTGIYTAIKKVLDISQVEPEKIKIVTVGTTHFLNAIIERDASRLDRVAIIRLSSNYTRSIPPFSDFPEDLSRVLYGHTCYVSGGLQIDGSLISAINEEEIVKECSNIRKKQLRVVVVAGVYSPIDTIYRQEERVKEIVLREIPDVKVVCSHDVGTIGFLERENSAILNASILRFSEYVVHSFHKSLKRLNLNALLFLTQNDGTMISSDQVKETPIVTFSSGPTNSILGAAYLSQMEQNSTGAIVADIGGTTTDIGILLPSGFPKQASAYLSVAGVRINMMMPQICSIGLGGGSIIRTNSNGDVLTVGPESVGYSLSEKSMVFGGDILTTTDIASIVNGIALENSIKRDQELQINPIEVVHKVHTILEKAIDSIKTSQEEMPLLLVGGGSIIVGDNLHGISTIIKPKYYQHANAVGAAVAKVSHVIDTIINKSDSITLDEILKEKKKLAIEHLVRDKNALKETCYIVDILTLPIQYSDNQLRIIIKAAGEINFNKSFKVTSTVLSETKFEYGSGSKLGRIDTADLIDIIEEETVMNYRPNVTNGTWEISQIDLKWLAYGCYVLGCAGGGSPQCEYLEIRNLLKEGHKIFLKQWEKIKDDEIVGWGGIMGSPTVSYERLGGTDTIDALSEILDYTQKELTALMCLEIGGANGLQALLMACTKYHNKPLLDCDWMGRAYPRYYQTTLAAHTENKLTPAAISDGLGNSVLLTRTTTPQNADHLLRAVCSDLGARVGYSGRPTEGDLVKRYSVKNTYSLAWRIGRQIAYCQENSCTNSIADRIIKEVGGSKHAKKLFCGKIVAVKQKLSNATMFGEIVIQSFNELEIDGSQSNVPFEAEGGILRIPFKNEIIYAEHEDSKGVKKVMASVPDLISVIDSQSGQAIGVPEFKYGLRVVVIAMASSALWNDTDKSKSIGGLDAFELDIDFDHVSIGSYIQAKSVIEEYNTIV